MAGKRHISTARWMFIGLLAAGAIGLCVVVAQGQGARGAIRSGAAAAGSSIYKADVTPEGIPQTLLPGLILLTPGQLTRVPEVDGFESPCGSPNGALVYDAQPFGSPNPPRGGQHCGSDLNGIGGENSDLGDPVRAAARGLVTYCGEPSPEWGKVVVLAHRLPGTNRIIQTLYAHLGSCRVRAGELVGRGTRLGTIGTANGNYPAHLHFEAMESRCTEAGMPGYSPHGTMNRLDPATLLAEHPAPAWADAYENLRRSHISTRAMQNETHPAAPVENGNFPADAVRIRPSQFLNNCPPLNLHPHTP